MLGSFVIHMLLAGSLSLLLGLINSLQLLVHLPLINVVTPANVMTLEVILVRIVMFDLFEQE